MKRYVILFNAADQDPINKIGLALAPGHHYPWISDSTDDREEADTMADALKVLKGFIGYAIYDHKLGKIIKEY